MPYGSVDPDWETGNLIILSLSLSLFISNQHSMVTCINHIKGGENLVYNFVTRFHNSRMLRTFSRRICYIQMSFYMP